MSYTKPKLDEAQELYREAIDATRDQRRQIEEDIRFSDPSNPDQWDDVVRRQRETDPGGARPCLVMDHTQQYVANVSGQVNKAPPALHSLPVDSGADKKVAEQLDGLFRHIEYSSRATIHYGIALTNAARCGVGYLVVRPEIVDQSLNYMEPRISSVADSLRAVFDPWSMELDGSDATFGYLLTGWSHREFEAKWGKDVEKKSFGDESESANRIQEIPKTILTAEQWYCEDKMRNMVAAYFESEYVALPEAEFWKRSQEIGANPQQIRSYKEKYRCVKWRKMSGCDILETSKDQDGNEADYPADAIGLIPVYGYWGISSGRLTYCGIPRRAMNPQRAYNYHMSEQLAYMGQAPKSPYMVAAAAAKGFEHLWDRASVDSRAWMPWNHIDAGGQPIPAPQRASLSINLQNHIEGAQQALHDLEASIGMYQANLGAPSNETSGVAIENRKQQGEASVSHFPQNLSFSIAQGGKICMQMAQRLIDTKRRQRIVGIDQSPGFVTIDPKQREAVMETDDGLSINPNIGKYDVRVVVGASYSTQRTQAQASLGEIMKTNPDLTPAIAPLWAQNLDIPHADKLAQVLTAMAPEAVQTILNPEGSKQPKTADLMTKIDQLQKGLDEAIQHAKDAQGEAIQYKQDAEKAQADLKAKEEENEIKAFQADTDRMKALGTFMTPEQVQVLVQQTIQEAMMRPDPLPPENQEPEGELGMQEPMQDEPMVDAHQSEMMQGMPPEQPQMPGEMPPYQPPETAQLGVGE